MKHYLIAILALMGGVYAVGQSSSGQSGSFSTTDSNTKPVASRNIDSAKEADIRQLMQLTGADKLADQMMVNLEANLKPVLTNTFPPGEYREKLVTLFFLRNCTLRRVPGLWTSPSPPTTNTSPTRRFES